MVLQKIQQTNAFSTYSEQQYKLTSFISSPRNCVPNLICVRSLLGWETCQYGLPGIVILFPRPSRVFSHGFKRLYGHINGQCFQARPHRFFDLDRLLESCAIISRSVRWL